MKRRLSTLLLLALIALGGYIAIERSFSKKYFLTVKGVSLEVEPAHTPYLRQKGLMGRHALSENNGMLFIFDLPDHQIFWMKNTIIPLSIAFISGEGVILEVLDMAPDSWDGKLASYRSKNKVRLALEVNQGWFGRHGIGVGDQIYFSRSVRKLLK